LTMGRFGRKEFMAQLFVVDSVENRVVAMCAKSDDADMVVKALNARGGEAGAGSPAGECPLQATHRLRKPFRDAASHVSIRRGARASVSGSRVAFLDKRGNVRSVSCGKGDSRSWCMVYDGAFFEPLSDWFEELG